MLPEIAEAHPVRHRRADQRVGRLREKDLAAVAGGADARRAVHVDPDVARDRVHRFARVQAHPDPHVGILRPLVVRDRSLRVDAGQQRRPRGREGDEQAVARGVDVAAAVRRDGFARRSDGGRSAGVVYSSPSCSRRRVDPSMSVKSRLTVPDGSALAFTGGVVSITTHQRRG